MPSLINDIGKGFDRLLHCKSIHPCFLVFFLCIAGCAIGAGVVYLIKGPGDIVQLALFGMTVILVCVLFFSHAYYIRKLRQQQPLPLQQPENV
jgi:hypothetical protein